MGSLLQLHFFPFWSVICLIGNKPTACMQVMCLASRFRSFGEERQQACTRKQALRVSEHTVCMHGNMCEIRGERYPAS